MAIVMCSDGIERERVDVDRSRDRYFVRDHGGPEREVDADGFIAKERGCGFHPKPGCGPFATGGFTQGENEGRIEHWFEGSAVIFDGDTGQLDPFGDCIAANEQARAWNEGLPRRRYYVQPARKA